MVILTSGLDRDMWSVHKFGGTCVGSSKRILKVADIILNDPSESKLVVVSAMSHRHDVQSHLQGTVRDDSYISSLDDIFEKHKITANDLLDGDDFEGFLSQLLHGINSLKAMLRASYILTESIVVIYTGIKSIVVKILLSVSRVLLLALNHKEKDSYLYNKSYLFGSLCGNLDLHATI